MRLRFTAVLVFLVVLAEVATADDSDADALRAAALLARSQAVTSLQAGLAPYRLKATFRLFGLASGDKTGTLLRDWVSDSQWREEITVGALHYVIARSGNKLWSTQVFEPLRLEQTRSLLGELLPGFGPRPRKKFKALKETKIDDKSVTCVVQTEEHTKTTTCIDPATVEVLRIDLEQDEERQRKEYGDYRPFRDRLVAQKRLYLESGNKAVELTVDSLSDVKDVDPAEFTAPARAYEDVICEGNFVVSKPILSPDPEFPAITGVNHARLTLGIVVLPDGTTADAYVIRTGGEAFDKVAEKALREWRFQPASCNGNPVKFRIHVEFSFDRR
jgi:TonB family protein